MKTTVQLAVLAFLLGAAVSFSLGFPLRFLVIAYEHGGFW